jgi:uncharacterized protein YndB with AHSA1/START domain
MLFNANMKLTLPSDREIVITRMFDAPRSMVFEAMSKPEFLKRWMLGPPGWEMTVCENDFKVGGTFRHAWRNSDGTEMAMSGVYREIVVPERISRTESFTMGCDSQTGEQRVTLVLAEKGQQTAMKLTVLYPSKEARDGTIASGMERGVAASYQRLDEILANPVRS